MKSDLVGDRFGGERIAHDQSEIREQIDSITSLRDLTDKRILVPKLPYSIIDYNADENYRKTGVDPNHESLQELGRGIGETGLQQPIALIAHDISAIDLKKLMNLGPDALMSEDLWRDKGRISIIFGNRRYLSITHHSNLTHSSAFIYPKETVDWVPTIALIENSDREDVPLIEESLGLVKEVNRKYNGVPARYAKFSGKPPADTNRLFVIGKACLENDDFSSIVASIKTKDKVALFYIAQAITDENVSKHRKEEIDKAIASLKACDGQITSARKKATQIKEYAEGKKGKLTGISDSVEKKQDAKPVETQAQAVTKPKAPTAKQLNKQLKGITEKFHGITPEFINDELKETALELRKALDKLGL